jgi:hypothetical protein
LELRHGGIPAPSFFIGGDIMKDWKVWMDISTVSGLDNFGKATSHVRYITRKNECVFFETNIDKLGFDSTDKKKVVEFWNKLEENELYIAKHFGFTGRKNARTQSRVILPLPNEMDVADIKQFMFDFLQKTEINKCIYTYALHYGKNNNNKHVHIDFSERYINDIKKKNRIFKNKDYMQKMYQTAGELLESRGYLLVKNPDEMKSTHLNTITYNKLKRLNEQNTLNNNVLVALSAYDKNFTKYIHAEFSKKQQVIQKQKLYEKAMELKNELLLLNEELSKDFDKIKDINEEISFLYQQNNLLYTHFKNGKSYFNAGLVNYKCHYSGADEFTRLMVEILNLLVVTFTNLAMCFLTATNNKRIEKIIDNKQRIDELKIKKEMIKAGITKEKAKLQKLKSERKNIFKEISHIKQNTAHKELKVKVFASVFNALERHNIAFKDVVLVALYCKKQIKAESFSSAISYVIDNVTKENFDRILEKAKKTKLSKIKISVNVLDSKVAFVIKQNGLIKTAQKAQQAQQQQKAQQAQQQQKAQQTQQKQKAQQTQQKQQVKHSGFTLRM